MKFGYLIWGNREEERLLPRDKATLFKLNGVK